VELPQPYRVLIEKISPKGVELEVTRWGGSFRAVVKKYTQRGFYRIDITGDDFLSFYAQLYETLGNSQPKKVSLSLVFKRQRLPYNPFFQIWDGENGIRLLKLSRLRPGCHGEVVQLTVKKISGAKVWVDFNEIREKLFEGGFKLPVYYCY
jgi:hypothetical protein